MAVRSAIRYWRLKRGMSQADLARAADIRADRLSRYESGDATPSGEEELVRLSSVLTVTVADLYSDEVLTAIRAAQEIA